MTTSQTPSTAEVLAAEFAASLAWWDDAGVTNDFARDATAWLSPDVGVPPPDAKPRTPANAKTPATPTPTTLDRVRQKNTPEPVVRDDTTLADSLAGFRDWWLAHPPLSLGSNAVRVPPRGPANSELMVIVPEPEEGDTDRLLNGANGRMLANVLTAMRVDPASIYIASVLPCVVPAADWSEIAEARIGRVALHHISLVKPARLLVMGANVPPLLHNQPAHETDVLTQIQHESGSTSVMTARTIANLRNLPGERARFWRKWLEWMDG